MENIDVYGRHLSFAEKDGKMVVRKSNSTTSIEYATAKKNYLEYYMYSRGSFCISFSGQNYSRTGAIARTRNLAKSFFNVKLIAVDANGFREKIWPIATKN